MSRYTLADLKPAIYRCPVCRAEYETAKEALQCANSTPAPSFQPGEFVVLAYPHYGWHNARNPEWVIKQGPEQFHHRSLYHFWHVVTHVDEGEDYAAHRPRYHVASLGVFNGENSRGWFGYTYDRGHVCIRRTRRKPPASVVTEGLALVGTKAVYLL